MKKIFLVGLSLIMLLSGCAKQQFEKSNIVIPDEVRIMESSGDDLIIQKLKEAGIVSVDGYSFYKTDKFNYQYTVLIEGQHKIIYLSNDIFQNHENGNAIKSLYSIYTSDNIVDCTKVAPELNDDVCKTLKGVYGVKIPYSTSSANGYTNSLTINTFDGYEKTIFFSSNDLSNLSNSTILKDIKIVEEEHFEIVDCNESDNLLNDNVCKILKEFFTEDYKIKYATGPIDDYLFKHTVTTFNDNVIEFYLSGRLENPFYMELSINEPLQVIGY